MQVPNSFLPCGKDLTEKLVFLHQSSVKIVLFKKKYHLNRRKQVNEDTDEIL